MSTEQTNPFIDVPAEQAVLAYVIKNPDQRNYCFSQIEQTHFSDKFHGVVFSAIKALHDGGSEKLDTTTIRNKIGEYAGRKPEEINRDVQRIISIPVHGQTFDEHVKIVRQLGFRRKLYDYAKGMMDRCVDKSVDINESFDKFMAAADGVRNHFLPKQLPKTIDQGIEDIQNSLGECRESGISFGIEDLDKTINIGGIAKGKITLIAGRPGDGKTSLAFHLALNTAKQGFPVLFFSLEQTLEELSFKAVSYQMGKPVSYIKANESTEEVQHCLEYIKNIMRNCPLFVVEKRVTVEDIARITQSISSVTDLKLILVDYIQIIPKSVNVSRGANEEAVISYNSSAIMELCKKTGIPAVVLTQLNRSIEKEDRAPRLSDLRGSGSLEQDAYTVIFSRPEKDPLSESNKAVVRCNAYVPKNRGGEITQDERPCTFIWNKATGQYYSVGETGRPEVVYSPQPKQETRDTSKWETIEETVNRLQREKEADQPAPPKPSLDIFDDEPQGLAYQPASSDEDSPF